MAKVLVVDDVPDNVKLLGYELEDHGHDVLAALDGEQALRLARSGRPDVILLDIMMPGMDGIEVCRRLKADPATEPIAVILVSARDQEEDVMRGLDAGAQDYVTKPFNGQVLAARVRNAARSKAAHDELESRVRARTAELSGANAALVESEQRYRFLADAMPQIVWGAKPDGDSDYFNRRWVEYTGQTFEEAREWGWRAAVHPDDLPLCLERWNRALRTGEPYDVEYRLRRASDGMARWQLARGLPMRDESGAIVHWVGTCTDIDDQKRAEEALRSAYDELESRVRDRTAELDRANQALRSEVAERARAEAGALKAREAAEAAARAKGEFLANMSHEIRTPMNGILGMTELTLASPLDPRQREQLGLVKSSAEALLTVIDDILDFSKIEAGKLDLDPVPFRLRDLVVDTLRVLAPRAHAKGLELACRVDPGVPDDLVGDPGRLRQVVVNLVGNAIKFTGRGEVVLSVAVEPPGADPSVLRWSVADTGIGIPPGKRRAIFEPFEQADGSTTRRFGGTGLGLSISAHLVALMGGRIWVEGEVGRGSTFHFTAGFGPVEGPGRPRPGDAAPPMAGARVLVVDGNETNRRILEGVLVGWGAWAEGVAAAPAARAALLAAEAGGRPFDAALIDATIPGLEGLLGDEGRPGRGSTALVLLTSGSGPEPGPGRGVVATLPKPVRPSELLDVLARSRGGAGAPAAGGGGPAPGPAGGPEAGRALRILVAEDHLVNQKVAVGMLRGMGHDPAVVDDGRAALGAWEAGGFDLILMDVQMPEMDGFEAVAAIRAREASTGAHVPILALTAHAMKGDRERCLEGGFDEYLSKPIRAEELRRAIERVSARAVRGARRPVDPGPPAPAEFDPGEALGCVGGDESLLAEVIGMFLDDGPRLLAEIDEAVGRSDAPSLKRLGHTIRGVAGNFGLPAVLRAARDLEDRGRAGDRPGTLKAAAGLRAAFDRVRPALESFARAGCPLA